MIGKRFTTLVRDMEEDEEFGEVIHPIGSVFKVMESQGEHCIVAWEGTAIDASGNEVPAHGMWCLWTPEEITTQAREIQ